MENIKVRCGELDAKRNYTESEIELKPHQDRRTKHISVHPAFNAKNLYYDFALIHLSTEFDLDEHIHPICLPSPDAVVPLFGDEDCYSMGYGKDSFGKIIFNLARQDYIISHSNTTYATTIIIFHIVIFRSGRLFFGRAQSSPNDSN